MKTRDILILVGALLFSSLFYNQDFGVNFALFSIFLVVAHIVARPQAIKHTNWQLAAAAVIFSSACMVWHSTVLAFFCIVFSWMLLSAYTYRPKAAAVLNFVQAGFSYLLSIPQGINGWFAKATLKRNGTTVSKLSYLPVYLLVSVIVGVFIGLYSASSSAFGKIIKNIDLSFISVGWLAVTILGFILSSAFIRHRRIKALDRLEKKWAAPLIAMFRPLPQKLENKLTVERKGGTLLLLLLNILLLVVNTSDFFFLFGGGIENSLLTYSQIVHQGIEALIASIVIAVAILLFLFRGQLNFDRGAKAIYYLALLWVAQNIVLVVTGAIKNGLYIDIVDGLTYKRVGVYYYLLLSTIGLAFTAYKLYAKKPNWYLVRVNFTVFFTVMVLSCAINWDVLITRRNMQQAIEDRKDPDIKYMSRLSYHNLTLLVEWLKTSYNQPETIHQYSSEQLYDLSERIYKKSKIFISSYEEEGWPSWNYSAHKTYKYLKGVEWENIYKPIPEVETYNEPYTY